MPDLTSLQLSLSKRVDMSKFFGPEAYVTIKRLSKKSKKIIASLALDVGIMKIAAEMAKNGKVKELSPEELGRKYLELPQEDRLESERTLELVESIYLEQGIDTDNHNLTSNGKKISLSVEFWEYFPEATKFIFDKIKEFNKAAIDYSLGEQIGKGSIM